MLKEFKLIWNDGKGETIAGEDFEDAFKRAGHGKKLLSWVRSHKEIAVTDAQVKAYIDGLRNIQKNPTWGQQIHGDIPPFESLTPEGRDAWRSKLTAMKFRRR